MINGLDKLRSFMANFYGEVGDVWWNKFLF